jgi:hypothetical protein
MSEKKFKVQISVGKATASVFRDSEGIFFSGIFEEMCQNEFRAIFSRH